MSWSSIDVTHRNHGLRTPPQQPHGPGPDRRAGMVAFWIALAVIVLLIAGLVMVAGGGGPDGSGDGNAAPDLENTETSVLDPAAPRDGVDSIGLPVTADPAADLADGQTVTVSGSGFPPGTDVGIVQCSPHLLPLEGVDRCMVSAFGTATTDDTGSVSTTFVVQRFLQVADQEIDCASPPPDGYETSCTLAVGALDNYDLSGIATLQFDPAAEAGPRATLSLDTVAGLADYQEVSLTIDNPGVGVEWHVNQCLAHTSPSVCGGAAVFDPVDRGRPAMMVSADGAPISARLLVRRVVNGTDCAREPEACSIVVQDGASGMLRSQRISFDPGISFAQPELSIETPWPLQAGAPIPVEVHFRGPMQSDHPLLQCPTGESDPSRCVPVGWLERLAARGSAGSVTLLPRIPLDNGSDIDCTTSGACELRYVDSSGGTDTVLPLEIAAAGP